MRTNRNDGMSFLAEIIEDAETSVGLDRSSPMPWARKLKAPIALHDGRRLRTLADARDLIRSLPPLDQQTEEWRHTTELLMAAAEGKWGAFGAAMNQLCQVLKEERLI
jgi:hypothetical protein